MWQLLGLLILVSAWLWRGPNLGLRIAVFLLLNWWLVRKAYRSGLLPSMRQAGLSRNRSMRPTVIAFAGAMIDLTSWTNRQQVMSRLAQRYPVLYVEPRVWLPRQIWRLKDNPQRLINWLTRLVWYQQIDQRLFVIGQANLIPGSRRWELLGWLNQKLNEWWVLARARWLGFREGHEVIWVYDTEAAAYLSHFPSGTVLYDCVDDHAVQAGLDLNPGLVKREEKMILDRADVVTVTSKRLYELKKKSTKRVELVLNAGDVQLYAQTMTDVPVELRGISRPILGSVGALDEYKYDFDLLTDVATSHPEWQFVFVGAPVVDRSSRSLRELTALENVHVLGAVERNYVPSFVQAFDVCLIPYRNNDYNQASFPLKFWEFMATGKPIVITGVPELKEYEPMIEYVAEGEVFADAVKRALRDTRADERRALASRHGFEQRVDRLVQLLEEVLQRKEL